MDEHVKVKGHVGAQQQLGNGQGALVQGALGKVLHIVRGPHDLAHVLPGRELGAQEPSQVMAVGRRVDAASQELLIQLPVCMQLILFITSED
jgi:hypothetical protein